MRKLTMTLLATVLGLAGLAAHAAGLLIVEEAVEMAPIDIRLTSLSSGRVVVVLCDECDPESLIITRQSRAYVGTDELAIDKVIEHAEGGGTVFYDRETRIVTRIIVWN